MASLRVAVVSRDPEVRLAAARAFDGAPASWRVELHRSVPAEADVLVFGPDCSGTGVVFDPAAPGRVLEEVAVAAGNVRSPLVAVTSPGGGAGATTLALHLAQAYAASGAATCFVDLDVRWGASDRLGLPDDARTWAELDEAEDSLALCALPVAAGFRALLAPRLEGEDARPAAADAVLRRVCEHYERVVADAPDGELLDTALLHARAAVAIMTPALPAARRMRAFLSRYPEVTWAVVTNRIGPGGEARRARLEDALERRIAVELPCAAALRDAEDEARLLSASWSRWQRAATRLARALEHE
ncbi:MAG: AAA family ATPase [Actinomycetota bacterium]